MKNVFKAVLILQCTILGGALLFGLCVAAYVSPDTVFERIAFGFIVTLFYGFIGLGLSEDREFERNVAKNEGRVPNFSYNILAFVVLHVVYVSFIGCLIAGSFR